MLLGAACIALGELLVAKFTDVVEHQKNLIAVYCVRALKIMGLISGTSSAIL